jgi:hypothetical protein
MRKSELRRGPLRRTARWRWGGGAAPAGASRTSTGKNAPSTQRASACLRSYTCNQLSIPVSNETGMRQSEGDGLTVVRHLPRLLINREQRLQARPVRYVTQHGISDTLSGVAARQPCPSERALLIKVKLCEGQLRPSVCRLLSSCHCCLASERTQQKGANDQGQSVCCRWHTRALASRRLRQCA